MDIKMLDMHKIEQYIFELYIVIVSIIIDSLKYRNISIVLTGLPPILFFLLLQLYRFFTLVSAKKNDLLHFFALFFMKQNLEFIYMPVHSL